VDYIDFRNPINVGEIVILKSQVNRVFRTSMEVGVKVFSENTLTGERKHTTTAYVTFVAIDSSTREPKAVSPLILKTAEEKRRWREAGKDERCGWRCATRNNGVEIRKSKREDRKWQNVDCQTSTFPSPFSSFYFPATAPTQMGAVVGAWLPPAGSSVMARALVPS